MEDSMKAKVIEHLRYLEKGGKPIDKSYGICRELLKKFDQETAHKIIRLFPEWPEYSGDDMFPIKHKKLEPNKAFHRSKNLWNRFTRFGKDRRRLCGWLADNLEG